VKNCERSNTEFNLCFNSFVFTTYTNIYILRSRVNVPVNLNAEAARSVI